MALIGTEIELAAELLRNGKLVAIPTETVYGLAANALDENAALAIFEAKQRPFFDPLIIHVDSIESAIKYAHLEDERLMKLARSFWPGPLTLLAPKKSVIPDLITSGLPKVAIRIPAHQLTLELLKTLDLPLAAPSANPFGYISPTESEHVNKQLGDKIEYILEGGRCEVGLESTIAGIEANNLVVYRLGGLSLEAIEEVAGPVKLSLNLSGDPKAPGQLKSHYAPKKPFYLGELSDLLNQFAEKKIALIVFGSPPNSSENIEVFNLSPSGNLKEAALNLFRFLRLADESLADVILAEKLPESGLGRAVNDRLKRAASE
jgi:L-threonylcarbamoyladenylate synthase